MTTTRPTPARRGWRQAVTVGLTVVAALATAACAPMPTSTSGADDTMPRPNPALGRVTYDDNTLYVGGVALHQFPGYRIDDGMHVPVGWPVLSSITLSSLDHPISLPLVAAVVFRQNEPIVADPQAPLALAEKTIGLATASVVAEATLTGTDRRCVYRVRSGPMQVGVGQPERLIGTVVAAGTARPSVGVTLNGGVHSDVERITKEIADLLCRDA